MSGFNIEAAIDGLAALMTTIPELQEVSIGAPTSLSAQVEGWITIGDPEDVAPWALGVYQLPLNLIAWFGYVVDGDAETAEKTMARYIQELVRRLIQNRISTVDGVTRYLNGSVDLLGLPRPAAASSDYATFAGQAARVWPCGVLITQREAIGG